MLGAIFFVVMELVSYYASGHHWLSYSARTEDWQWSILLVNFLAVLWANYLVLAAFVLIGSFVIIVGILGKFFLLMGIWVSLNWIGFLGIIDQTLPRVKCMNLSKLPRVPMKDLDAVYAPDIELYMKRDKCSICLCKIEEESLVTQLPYCEHFYHHSCLEEWFMVDSKCPICKRDYLETYL